MLRVPAICVLMLIQLFAGSRNALYLCVASDGKVSGICSGPLLCTTCHDDVVASSGGDESEGSSRTCARGCCHHDHNLCGNEGSADSTLQLASDRDCDCDHKLISCENVRSISRAVIADELAGTHFSLVATLPGSLVRVIACGYTTPHYAPPPDRHAAVAILSTIVIRC